MNRDWGDNRTLDGVRLNGRVAPLFWRRLSNASLTRRGIAAYAVLFDELLEADRRKERRRKTRLQSGKVVAEDDRFLVDCIVINRTPFGARLTLGDNVRLPKAIWLYDDQSKTLRRTVVAWQIGRAVGCRFPETSTLNKPRLLRRLQQRYYAMR